MPSMRSYLDPDLRRGSIFLAGNSSMGHSAISGCAHVGVGVRMARSRHSSDESPPAPIVFGHASMTPYLNSLVARTLGRAEIVRPRIASLFSTEGYGRPPAPPFDSESEAATDEAVVPSPPQPSLRRD